MILRCPNGHEWFDLNASQPARCPTCSLEARPVEGDATMGWDAGIRPAPVFPAIDGYEILAELGRGGMGVVYRARQLKLNRTVALKMVLAGAHASERSLARFLSEAEIAAGLQHSHIVQIYELGEHDKLPYIAMEFVTGGGLSEWIAKRRGEYAAVAGLFEKLARAAHWAHQKSIVHRDLKPANVLIGGDGEPKIGDFGLAKRLDDTEHPRLTLSGEKMGTPDYMAPEQVFDELGAISPATDGYALGAMLYEALCGQVPIKGRSEMDWMRRLQREDPPSPAYYSAGIPRDLETICMKCLRKLPGERYATAEALAEDLQRFRNFQPILAKPLSPVTKCWRWVKRRVGKIAAALLVTAALTGGGLWWRHQHLYVWETAQYFGEVQRVHGEYRGRGEPLDDAVRAHRQSSERLVRAGTRGRVLRVESVDSSEQLRWYPHRGFLIPDLFSTLPARNQPCQVLLRYNEDGRVSEERLRNRSGEIVVILRYSYPADFLPGQMAVAMRVDFLDERGGSLKTATGIEGYQLYRDKNGRDAILRFINAREESVADSSAVYGWRFEWDERSFLKAMTFLNQAGVPAANKYGTAGRRFECDAQGRVTRWTNFDLPGQVVEADGVAIGATKFDEWGNIAENEYFAADGKTPARFLSQKFTGTVARFRYDSAGRLREQVDEGVNPAEAGYSMAKSKYVWKADGGYSRSTAYLDAHGQPARLGAGGTETEQEFDADERLVRFVSSGWEERPAGFFKVVQVNAWGSGDYPRQSVSEFFDAQGRRAWRSDGFGKRTEELDDYGRTLHLILEEITPKVEPYFRKRLDYQWAAAPASPQLHGGFVVRAEDLGFSSAEQEQADSRGKLRRGLPTLFTGATASGSDQLRLVTARFENESGQLVASKAGNTGFTKEFDAQGLVTENQTGFDPAKTGFFRQTISYQRQPDGTRLARWECFAADGKKVPNAGGYIDCEEKLDAAGRAVETTNLAFDAARLGYAREVIRVDWRPDGSHSTHWQYFDATGQRVPKPEGYLEDLEQFDPAGRLIETTTSGWSEAKQGHAKESITVQWKPDGARSKRWRYYNAAGQQVPNKDGCLDYEEQFTVDGTLQSIRTSGYPEDHGYDAEVKEFSEWKDGVARRKLWHYEDKNGKRVRWDNLYLTYLEEFNERGALVRVTESEYNPEIEPFYARITDYPPAENREKGLAILTYRDARGEPQRGPQGELKEERVLRPDGTMVERRLTGFDEARHGFAQCSFAFNSDMAVIRADYFDGAGKKVPLVHPYICFVVKEGAAEKLRLRVGDRLVAYNGTTIINAAEFSFNTPTLGGDLEIERDGKRQTIGGVPRGRLGIYLEDRAAK